MKKPMPPKPISIIDQVAGSGTGAPVRRESRKLLLKSEDPLPLTWEISTKS
jgi:hypothetical protein